MDGALIFLRFFWVRGWVEIGVCCGGSVVRVYLVVVCFVRLLDFIVWFLVRS